jgi:ABC-type cobalamin/Fe3+-siderophores transport system ATPase subunit
MSIADDIVAVPSGARFYRADLHIHSYGASHDVKDAAMTPEAIVQTALSENLSLIAVTDHNEITNVAAAIKASEGTSVTVVPGVELSTPEGHLLVYFETFGDLSGYYGKLSFAGKGTADSRCQTSLLECLKAIDPAKGFAILAHVDGDGGLEQKVSGYPPHKADIICQSTLLGIELRSAKSTVSFSDLDPAPERAQYGKKRIESLKLGAKQFLARVLFSDSHSLAALGKNASGQRRMTRVKMDSPAFAGLRVALQDADARVRIEDDIPESVPYVLGMKLEGGFLDGQTLHFSRNLNCIIGGRGAGKSTAFESVRCISPAHSESNLLDSEIWPERLSIVWIDQAGQQHTIMRPIEEPCVNLDDPDLGPTVFPIESYGQNETAQTSTKAQSDPRALLDYLDQFLDLQALRLEDQQFRDVLLQNQTEIEKAQVQVARIPDYKKLLANVQQQLKTLESAQAQEVVALERRVAEERSIRENIERQVGQLSSQVKTTLVSGILGGLQHLAVADQLKVGSEEYKKIVSLAAGFEATAKTSEQDIAQTAGIFSVEVKKHLDAWKSREYSILSEIETKRKALQAQGIKLDMAYIKKLATDESAHKQSLENLQKSDVRLKELTKARLDLLTKRTAILSRITALRVAYATKANSALKGALSDLTVVVRFSPNALSEEAEQIIQQAMNWRTVQVPRAALIAEQVTIPTLLDCIKKKDPAPIANIIGTDGLKPFNKTEALEILDVLGQLPNLFRLQRCEIDDRPRITVTKVVQAAGKPQSRDFSKLSLGQQQSVLLALMLSSDSNMPLIIDQPEDNLDSEFIFHSLVPVLRTAKERRQVIIVTHNPNIAVLGDAELIIALKSTSDKSTIVARGSIDEPNTKKMVCQILEGAEEAFRRRARMYGII